MTTITKDDVTQLHRLMDNLSDEILDVWQRKVNLLPVLTLADLEIGTLRLARSRFRRRSADEKQIERFRDNVTAMYHRLEGRQCRLMGVRQLTRQEIWKVNPPQGVGVDANGNLYNIE